MATTNLQRLFARPGSNLASIEGVIGEILDTQLGRDFGSAKVDQLVRDFAATSTFELWENMLQWQIALDARESKDPRWDQLQIDVVLRLWVSQPFRLPTLEDMPREPREAKEAFLQFYIDAMEGEAEYREDIKLFLRLSQFRDKLSSGDF